MLKHVESIVLFVPNVEAAARWYAEIFSTDVGWENEEYAFVKAPGVVIGFHPADGKCPGGVGGTTVYWEVDSIAEAVCFLVERGATLHRGPAVTSFGAGAAMLKDPFGCTMGLNASTAESRARVGAASLERQSAKVRPPVPGVVFQSARLLCRRWIAEDFEPLLAVYSDAEAMRWVGGGKPVSRDECEEWFKVTRTNYDKRGYGMFSLVERDSGTVVGFAGLVHPAGQPQPEVKYALLRSHWGAGLASEAVPQLLAYGASAHGLRRIIATVAAGNAASQRVLTKAGMTLSHRRANDDGSTTLVFEWDAWLQASDR